ncbi:AraC family transcriptional regulator [Streptomyces sp. NPDC005799]|uniref:AraC family transcriptional regulator n=1 Tax=Streptomyces sp. NPDC005799 TaxID=3154678 RepID=UPI0033D327C2
MKTHHPPLPRLIDLDALKPFETASTGWFREGRGGHSEVLAPQGVGVMPAAQDASVPSVLRSVELTHMTLGVVRFSSETRIVSGPVRGYHIAVPIRGEMVCRYGRDEVTVRPGFAAVATPDLPSLVSRWSTGAEMLGIKIRPDVVEDELSTIIGRTVRSVVRLSGGFDLTTPAGRSWLSVLELLLAELADPDRLARVSRSHREQLERLLISSLLRAQGHDFSADVRAEAMPARWRAVKRVVDAIQEFPERPWSLNDLAELAGVSGRRLQQGFNAQVGVPPMRYLQDVRLERVHRDLLDGAEQVSELSLRWGFTHSGRFAGAYRARYGETPSETRRRVQSVLP